MLAKSQGRVKKERSLWQQRLRLYHKTLKNTTQCKTVTKRDDLHQAIGTAKKEAGHEGRYLLSPNMSHEEPAKPWEPTEGR